MIRVVASEVEIYDAPDGTRIISEIGLPSGSVLRDIVRVAEQYGPAAAQAMSAVASWERNPDRQRRGTTSMLRRDRFVDPQSTMARIRTARAALDDDIVGGAADLTESLALSAVSISLPREPDVESVWNQWAGVVNLDGLLRDCWADLFSDSQTVVASWWERREFQVNGVGPAGLPRRKKFSLVVPTAMSTIDSTRVVPVGTSMFGREVLAYVATTEEAEAFEQTLGSKPEPSWRNRMRSEMPALLTDDAIVKRLVRYRYTPSRQEADELVAAGLSHENVRNLFVLDSNYVWRHTLTKSHLRFPRVRLASVFELLDMKSNLRAKDRAELVGATNYIVLIKQGSDLSLIHI